MDSATTQRLLISLAAIVCLNLMLSTPAYSELLPTAYQVLQGYDFPAGLLPEGVKGYYLDSTTGKFSTYFNDNCTFSQGQYQLQFKSTIQGYISKGRLSSLDGVSVTFLRVSINIVEIVRQGNDINISVGIGSAWFPMDYFEESPQCGCGMSCSLRQAKKLLPTDPSASS